jgi:uncharacterized membrane protein
VTRARESSAPNPEIDRTLARLAAAHPELEIRRRQKATPWQHVVVWIVGSVIAGLIPVGFTALHGLDNDHPPGFYDLLGTGDLLLIAIVISIAGIAELALVLRQTRPDQILWVALLILGNLLFIVSAALWFGDLASRVLEGEAGNPVGAVAFGSIALFAVAAGMSSTCVWLAAGVD